MSFNIVCSTVHLEIKIWIRCVVTDGSSTKEKLRGFIAVQTRPLMHSRNTALRYFRLAREYCSMLFAKLNDEKSMVAALLRDGLLPFKLLQQ
jgi:hypothetical protein